MARYLEIKLRITSEQRQILEARAKSAGHTTLAYYMRSVLFRSISMEEKINQIWEKVCKNG